VPIAQPVIDAMEAEIRGFRESRPDLYLAFYFMLWLGMRKGEVAEARLEWIEEWPTGARMAIVPRSYYRPKGIAGVVSMAPALLAEIKALSGATEPGDYLIPAENATVRRNLLRYDLSQIVRKHLGQDRKKTCHELRKHAVSMVLMRTRSYVDTLKFSRHSDVRTLQEHYGSFLDELAPIESSDWRSEIAAVMTS
jgi:integrase